VPAKDFQNAVAWASDFFQGTVILSPSLGGIIYAIARGPAAVYALSLFGAIVAAVCAAKIRVQSTGRAPEPLNWQSTLAGLHYIWREKMILAPKVMKAGQRGLPIQRDRKSTRLNSSHVARSYAVLCLKKNKTSATFQR